MVSGGFKDPAGEGAGGARGRRDGQWVFVWLRLWV